MKENKKKIKILRIIARLNIGGPAIHTILLSEGLNEQAFSTVLVVGVPEANEGNMLYLAKKRGIDVRVLPQLGRKINLHNDLAVLWRLCLLIRKESPDIIHTHTAKAGTLGRFAGLLTGVPILVHTFHGHTFHSYFDKTRTKLFILIERFLSLFTDRVIGVSDSVREDLLNLKIGKPKKTISIPLGLELNKFFDISLRRGKDIINIGIIGRLVPVKNHRMFLVAAKLVLSRRKDKVIKFIIVGDGELREYLEAYARQLEIQEHVIFKGWQENMREVYNDLDIVAMTSLNEGIPVALIEAMAAAKAIIATNVGGVKDLFNKRRDSANGHTEVNEMDILVDSDDREALAEGLIKLIDDEGLRHKIGLAGRSYVNNVFTKKRLIKDIEELYLSLVRAKGVQ